MPILQVMRTPKGGAVGADHFQGHGTVLRPVDDPEGVVLEPELFKAIRLEPDFPKIPAELADRISSLYVTMLGRQKDAGFAFAASDSQKEVSVVLLRDEETQRKWRVLVPTQVVGGATVEADYTQPMCDIVTGEKVEQFPPPGWLHAGSSHSHNTMPAFFSGVDDRNELPMPGVHFVLGNFQESDVEGVSWNFDVAASIVYHHRRYEQVVEQGQDGSRIVRKLVWSDILEFTASTDHDAHKNVLEYISLERPASIIYSGPSHSGWMDGQIEDYYERLYGNHNTRPLIPDRYKSQRVDRRNTNNVARVRSIIQGMTRLDLGKCSSKEIADWITAFDRKVGDVGAGVFHRAFDDALTPKEVLTKHGIMLVPNDPKDEGQPITEIQKMFETGFWCPVQAYACAELVEVNLCFFKKVGEHAIEFYIRVHKDRWCRARVIYASMIKEVLREQRAAVDSSSTMDAWRRDKIMLDQLEAEALEEIELDDDDVDGFIGFATRGIKATDFTKTEIDLLIRAWAHDKELGSFLRESVNCHVLKNGVSKR